MSELLIVGYFAGAAIAWLAYTAHTIRHAHESYDSPAVHVLFFGPIIAALWVVIAPAVVVAALLPAVDRLIYRINGRGRPTVSEEYRG